MSSSTPTSPVWPPGGGSGPASVHVGRRLGELLIEAGLVEVAVRAAGSGGSGSAALGDGVASFFEVPAVVSQALATGAATEAELAEAAEGWRAWGRHPGSVLARFWFEAIGRLPG